MISFLSGKVEDITGNIITLNVNGVGYEVICSRNALSKIESNQQALSLIIYTDVKEDSIRLFGFEDRLEKQVFVLLTQVKDVGPKTASEILSQIDKLDLLRIIGSENLNALQAVRGVGKKTAARIIVELKDKVLTYISNNQATTSGLVLHKEISKPFDEAMQALLSLGFSRKDAERSIRVVESNSAFAKADSGLIVKEALRHV